MKTKLFLGYALNIIGLLILTGNAISYFNGTGTSSPTVIFALLSSIFGATLIKKAHTEKE